MRLMVILRKSGAKCAGDGEDVRDRGWCFGGKSSRICDRSSKNTRALIIYADMADAFASKPAPTGEMRFKCGNKPAPTGECVSNVGAGLLAKIAPRYLR
ncbi:hypothetical protein C2E19_18340 [Pseudomonas sp. DTU12.3]|nr:hypothetical protein C2E19_18340 [Pseudomonas sp. DTU12.3]